MSFVDDLVGQLTRDGDRPVLEVLSDGVCPVERYCRRDLLHATSVLAARLAGRAARVAVAMANTPEWVAADLALLRAGCTEVPVPLAFSAEQARSLLREADLCLVDAAGARRLEAWGASCRPEGQPAVTVAMQELLAAPAPPGLLPARAPGAIAKIVHTSGTTGTPKGVKLRQASLEALLQSLRQVELPGRYDRYFSVVPLSLLIEQVTAVYLTLLNGGLLVFGPRAVPILGEHGASPRSVMPLLRAARPTGLMLPPAMLDLFHALCRQRPELDDPVALSLELFGTALPPSIGTGGAPTSPEVLSALAARGLTIYEGYGLSETCSIVATNTPDAHRIGTVGRPLAHLQVRLGSDNELLVRGPALFAGYTHTSDPSACVVDGDGWLHTGDLATIDGDGFIRILGRKKNLIVTALGRNVSPEWLEARYQGVPGVQRAVVFGDGLPALEGFFVVDPHLPVAVVVDRVRAFGLAELGDIDRAEVIVTAPATPELYRDLFTITGRPRRADVRAYMQGHAPAATRRPP